MHKACIICFKCLQYLPTKGGASVTERMPPDESVSEPGRDDVAQGVWAIGHANKPLSAAAGEEETAHHMYQAVLAGRPNTQTPLPRRCLVGILVSDEKLKLSLRGKRSSQVSAKNPQGVGDVHSRRPKTNVLLRLDPSIQGQQQWGGGIADGFFSRFQTIGASSIQDIGVEVAYLVILPCRPTSVPIRPLLHQPAASNSPASGSDCYFATPSLLETVRHHPVNTERQSTAKKVKRTRFSPRANKPCARRQGNLFKIPDPARKVLFHGI